MPVLTPDQRSEFLSENPAWAAEGTSIVRSFEFAGFAEAMAFVTKVALLAEKADHHPDIDIRWNTVTLRLSTHSEGGLTGKDIALATQIDT